MKTIVIYKSQTGFSKKYAEWIAKELSCEIMEEEKCKENVIENFDTIIYGAGIMAGQIKGLKKMKTIMLKVPNKNFLVYSTGATLATQEDKIQEIINANFTEDEKKSIPFFYLQGGLNYEKMKLPARILMKTMSNMIEKKAAKSNLEPEMSLKESFDGCDKKFIEPLVECVKCL